jgi:hypothetical protein
MSPAAWTVFWTVFWVALVGGLVCAVVTVWWTRRRREFGSRPDK